MRDFSIILILKGIITFYRQRVHETKNINFNKNFNEYSFRDKNLVLQLIQKS